MSEQEKVPGPLYELPGGAHGGYGFHPGKALSDLSEKELRKEREKIGMIFQHFNLLMQKSVLENVCSFYIFRQNEKARPGNEPWSF